MMTTMPTRTVRRLAIGAAAVLLATLAVSLFVTQASADSFIDQRFHDKWNTYDAAIKSGTDTTHSWVYGPEPHQGETETYAEAPGGKRQVLYFDKARMELTLRPANVNAVTAGLLTVELVSGKRQEGDTVFVPGTPAQVPVAGDSDDPTGPTYASFTKLATLPGAGNPPAAQNTLPITQTVGRDGTVSTFGGTRPVQATNAYYIRETGHNIPDTFINWLNAFGAQRGVNWVDFMGFPVTEAYWATVKVGGVQKTVLMQLFERRALTFTASNNPPYQVEFGNIGAHYFAWRYGNTPPGTAAPPVTAPETPAPTANPPAPTPPATGSGYSISSENIFNVSNDTWSVAGFIQNTGNRPEELSQLSVTFVDGSGAALDNGTGDANDLGRIPAGGKIPFRIDTNAQMQPAKANYSVTLDPLSDADTPNFTSAFTSTTAPLTSTGDGDTKVYTTHATLTNKSGASVTGIEAFIVVYDAAGKVIDEILPSVDDLANGASENIDEDITDDLPDAPDHIAVFATALKM